jgi:predicted nucleic acid-binding protein
VLVVDASVALAAVLPGEVRGSDAMQLMETVAKLGARVPSHWSLEVCNGILLAERRARISADIGDELRQEMDDLPVEVDSETRRGAFGITTALARRHRLTVYDAAYLELALRLALPLATFDTPLARAAAAEGVALFTA